MLTRRYFIAAAAVGALAGRAAAQAAAPEGATPLGPPVEPPLAPSGALQLEVAPQPLDAVLQLPPDTEGDFVIPERYRARVVPVQPGLPPTSIHIVPQAYHLYFILPGDQAIRYGVAIGQEGLGWRGQATIGRKAEWPSWRPTDEMIERNPEQYAQYADGMPGGPTNPLGARALYFYQGNQDTAIRVHGTIVPASIGSRASNGCFRMYNSHVIDLYNRVPLGAQAYAY